MYAKEKCKHIRIVVGKESKLQEYLASNGPMKR